MTTAILKVPVLVLALLLLGQTLSAQQLTEEEKPTQKPKNCVSREEFESLQRELKYWQNTTINILKEYLLDREGEESNNCPVGEDSYLKDRVEELDLKIEGVLNHTQDIKAHLLGIESKVERIEEQISYPSIGTFLNHTQSINAHLLDVERKMDRIEGQISYPSIGTFLNPASSCKIIPQGSPSGHYWIQHTGTGYANLEYCDMTRRCCNSTGGWMRVAHLNMTDSKQQCPSGFRLITSPKRTCGTPGRSCVSTTFLLSGVKYSRVCGKIIAYQKGSPDAFSPYYSNRAATIDNTYVEGVSLTYGQRPRNHIWTFAAALDEVRSNYWVCPCTKTNTPYTGAVPPFIGQDYFCDTGSTYQFRLDQFYSADPLWDGSGCGSNNSCCGFNNPPWFCKQLSRPTTDDIEMRVCVDQHTNDEDVALESVEIYVQ